VETNAILMSTPKPLTYSRVQLGGLQLTDQILILGIFLMVLVIFMWYNKFYKDNQLIMRKGVFYSNLRRASATIMLSSHAKTGLRSISLIFLV